MYSYIDVKSSGMDEDGRREVWIPFGPKCVLLRQKYVTKHDPFWVHRNIVYAQNNFSIINTSSERPNVDNLCNYGILNK